jgi:chromosome segregation ATPase
VDAQLVQAENLKLAQNRLNEMEKELEKLRGENESLYSATEVAKEQVEQLSSKVLRLERLSKDDSDTHEQELAIYKNSLNEKDEENLRLRQKVQEMEARLSADLKKIRVRERELENRLELSKLEKSALVRSKDDTILDLQRKIDQLTHELDTYKNRCIDLSEKVEGHHDQLSRTVRALRLALTNLEVSENTGVTIAPLKKAE